MSKFSDRFSNLLAIACPLIIVETHEEARCFQEIAQTVKARATHLLYYWDITRGLKAHQNEPPQTCEALNEVFELLGSPTQKETVCVFFDAHAHFDSPAMIRLVRALLPTYRATGKTLVFVSPHFKIPVEWQKEVQTLDYLLPGKKQLDSTFGDVLGNFHRNYEKDPRLGTLMPEPEDRERITSAATGLTADEADTAFNMAFKVSMQTRGTIVLDSEFASYVFQEKIQVLRSGLLDYAPTPFGFDSVGGFLPLKNWIMQRKRGFLPAARAMKLPLPKGVILGGFKGTGKTVTAMAIAHETGFPFFKLDIGKLFGGLVGQSEQNTRQLIRTLEGIGEAVVLIDEMEKYLNTGATSGAGDSGTSSRVFGTLISWMALKTCPVFLVATVNDIDRLPPELIRKGRFDELWWCDLPDASEREAIFKALLSKKFGRIWPTIPKALIAETANFSGAEIEACIVDALYECLLTDVAPERLDESLACILETVIVKTKPQSQIDPAKVNALRAKAEANFRIANNNEKPEAVHPLPTRKINVDNN